MQEKIAEPTIGRVVYVYSHATAGVPSDKPMAAIVADVDGLKINAQVIGHSGDILLGGVQNIPHISERSNDVHFWWDWMPFQKGQAAKTEQLQAELDGRLRQHSSASSKVVGDRDMDELHKNQASTPSPADGKR